MHSSKGSNLLLAPEDLFSAHEQENGASAPQTADAALLGTSDASLDTD
jgi:hypothetical protein